MAGIRIETGEAGTSLIVAPSTAAAKSCISPIRDRNAAHPDPISAAC